MTTLVSPGGELEVTVGRSLRHRGDELLHEPGVPFLYPWANRLAAFDYTVLGKHVVLDPSSKLLQLDENGLPIHGLLGGWTSWEVEARDSALTKVLDFGAHPELLEAFPFSHTLRLNVEAGDSRVEVATTVEADRDAD